MNDFQIEPTDWQDLLENTLVPITGRGFRLIDPEGKVLAKAGAFSSVCEAVQGSPEGKNYCELHCWQAGQGTTMPYCEMHMARFVIPVRVDGVPCKLFCGDFRFQGIEYKKELGEKQREIIAQGYVTEQQLRDCSHLPPIYTRAELKQKQSSLKRLIHQTIQKIADKELDLACRNVRSHLERVELRDDKLWSTIAEAIRFVVPVKRVEIFTIAPARDAVTSMYPVDESQEIVSFEELQDVEDAAHARNDRGEFILRLHAEERLLGAFRVFPADDWQDVDLIRLLTLAEDTAKALMERRRRLAQKMLDELNPVLAETEEPRERLEILLEKCGGLLGCHDGDISLHVPEQTPNQNADEKPWLKVVARWRQESYELPLHIVADRGIVDRVLRTKEIAVVPDTSIDEDFRRIQDEDDAGTLYVVEEDRQKYHAYLETIRACVKLPLKIGEQVIGVLCLHRSYAGAFNLGVVHVVEFIVERAVVEAACMQVSERRSRQARRLREALAGSVELAQKVADMEPAAARQWLFQDLARQAMNMGIRGVYRTATCVIDPLWKQAVVAAPLGDWPENFVYTIDFMEKHSAVMQAIKTRKSYVIDDVKEAGAKYLKVETPGTPDETRSTAAILLQIGTHVLGVLAIDSKEAAVFDPLIDSLEQLAGRYAAVIKTFDVDEEMARIEASLRKSRESELFDYQRFLKAVGNMLGVGEGALFLRRTDTGRYHMAANLKFPEEVQGNNVDYEWGWGLTGWVIKHNEALRLPDLYDEDHLRRVAPDLERKRKSMDREEEFTGEPTSFLAVPISVGDEVLGVIRFNIPAKRRFFDSVDQQNALGAAFRLAEYLYEREKDKRVQALLKLAVSIPRRDNLQELAQAVFVSLQEGLGVCGAHLRIKDKVQRGAAASEEVLLRLAFLSPPWAPDWKPSFFHTREEDAAGWVWRHGEPFYEPDVRGELSKCIESLESPKAFLDVAGAVICQPCFLEDEEFLGSLEEFLGSLHVYKQNRYAFSNSELAFVKEVARVTAGGLKSIADKETRRLQLNLKRAGNDYLADLLHEMLLGRETPTAIEKDFSTRESEFLHSVLKKLLAELGGEQAQGWLLYPGDLETHFSVMDAKGKWLKNEAPPVPISDFQHYVGPDRMRLGIGMAQEQTVSKWLASWRPFYHKKVASEKTQICLLAVMDGEQMLAAFGILSRLPNVVRHANAAAARDALSHIGETMRLAREIRDAEIARPLSLLGATVSRLEHDARSPLAYLLGAIEDLLKPGRSLKRQQEMLEIIREEKERIGRFMKQLTSLVGCSRQQFVEIDLERNVQQVVENTRRKSKGAKLIFRAPHQSAPVSGLENYLNIALEFILKNALDAVGRENADGFVQITMTVSGEDVLIKIEDNGPGMNRKTLKRALEPFFTTKKTGSGLGLPAAYSIIRSHQGKLTLRSENGQGVQALISLPLSQGNVQADVDEAGRESVRRDAGTRADQAHGRADWKKHRDRSEMLDSEEQATNRRPSQ